MVTLYLYKKGYLATEFFGHFIKISTGIGLILALSYCIRGFGRARNENYRKFILDLEEAKANYNDANSKKKLRRYDFEFEHWPIDFSMKALNNKVKKSCGNGVVELRGTLSGISFCNLSAFFAIHTFGIKFIYPGSIRLIQKFLHPMLVQGRAKLVLQHGAIRNKIETFKGNTIDTIFVDNRSLKTKNGETLVITAEGNAGFYEIGIMSTPIEMKYSVLGYNHPGFGGSNGAPFPHQTFDAADAVMQFAIHHLRFLPENILLFGWSIGGFSSLWLATQYPNVKGVFLDATFDDLLYLAIPRMPECLSGVVKIAIREHCNLNNNELILKYDGPVAIVRRTVGKYFDIS